MFRQAVSGIFLALLMCITASLAMAAPYAALVVDARTGEVLHSNNADTRLHPASLTKMMTLYIAFEAVQRGEISLDTPVTISKRAAAEPPSKLGLKSGQRVAFKYLIRAAAVKSANDAATAIAEAISGSEAKFARRMNKTAKALGMTRTTFKNAHGLTESGHMSTARDMTMLGRHLFYDYPKYYNLFSRRVTNAAGKSVRNTNRRFLAAYEGADGIKTGYTQAAGFNLVASARRGNERVIATLFGGRSTATRNAKVAELLDLGFRRAPETATTRKPKLPVYEAPVTIRLVTAVKKSPRPLPRIVRTDEEKQEVDRAVEEAVAAATSEADETVKIVENLPEPRDDGPKVVSRMSTSDGRHWGIHLGTYSIRTDAEKLLLTTALQDLRSLDGALRKVVSRNGKYQASFVGMTEVQANRACSRLKSKRQSCTPLGPDES